MKRCFNRIVLLLILSGCSNLALAALPAAVDGQPLPSLAPILKEVTPSVVNVYTQTRVRVRSRLLDDPIFRRFFNVPDVPRERVSQSLGSGVIVDAENGYVLTNNHVIEGADDISVTLKDGRNLSAELIGTDPDTDLAVIKIPAEDLQALPLANSDELQVGDFVVAVGNPFGLGQTVTSGIVSALGRTGIRGLEFQNFIQTDASINPGNSGGALINLRGRLVGINSAIFTPSGGNVGIGFAIPSSMAIYVMDQLVRFGEVKRGTLGLLVQDLAGDLAGAFGVDTGGGVLVAEVVDDSEADKAGIRPGDVLLSVNGRQLQSAQDFYNMEGQATLGETVTLEYQRDQEALRTRLDIQALPELNGGLLNRRLRGARFSDLPVRLRNQQMAGVLLTDLDEDSQLARQGLQKGDVITAINRRRVNSLADMEALLEDSRGPILMQIRRGREAYIARIN